MTTDSLLKKKAYAEFLEPFEARVEGVTNFCKRVNPNLFTPEGTRLITFGLEDPVGRAGTDPDIEALILTREVERGGKMVNDARASNGLNEVSLVFVDMVLADVSEEQHASQFSNKTSSTFIREYLSKSRI